jgi:DNA-binding transcriptional MerR regulator
VNEQTGFTIDDLAASVGIPIRTIRFYVSQGLLPGPGARGKLATYSDEHLLRLRLIRRLVDQRVPLAEIRERLESLTSAEIRDVLADEEQRSATRERAGEQSPKDYVAALLDQARAKHHQPVVPPPQRTALLSPASPPRPGAQQRRGQRESDVWRRLELAPGVELHVRADAELRDAELIDRVIDVVRTLGSASPEDSTRK